MKRPQTVEIIWSDPWTGEFCAGGVFAYDRRRAARSWYSTMARRMEKIAKQWTQNRKPRLTVRIK